jgi:hypothetical protein
LNQIITRGNKKYKVVNIDDPLNPGIEEIKWVEWN